MLEAKDNKRGAKAGSTTIFSFQRLAKKQSRCSGRDHTAPMVFESFPKLSASGCEPVAAGGCLAAGVGWLGVAADDRIWRPLREQKGAKGGREKSEKGAS